MEARFECASSVSDLPSYFADHFVEERVRIDYRKAHAFLGERFYAEAQNKAEERIAKFNTPNFDKANRLFADLVGFQNVVGRSTWHGMGPDRVEEKLDRFVFRRGELVHTGTSEQDLYLRDIRENRTFLDGLAQAIAQTAESDWRALCADKGWSGITP